MWIARLITSVSLCCIFVTFDVSLVDERAVDVIRDCEEERDGEKDAQEECTQNDFERYQRALKLMPFSIGHESKWPIFTFFYSALFLSWVTSATRSHVLTLFAVAGYRCPTTKWKAHTKIAWPICDETRTSDFFFLRMFVKLTPLP